MVSIFVSKDCDFEMVVLDFCFWHTECLDFCSLRTAIEIFFGLVNVCHFEVIFLEILVFVEIILVCLAAVSLNDVDMVAATCF